MIPKPAEGVFVQGIDHPDLHLWDAWSCTDGDALHLYCLAVSRRLADGTPLKAETRNNHPFHIRHFRSDDAGLSWQDLGVFQQHQQAEDGHDSRSIWSGSVMRLNSGQWLFGYTGLRERGAQHSFVQSLAAGLSDDGMVLTLGSQQLLLCPERDYELIRSKGYYLDNRENLGSHQGEAGGPILAWRDPFMFYDLAGQLMMAWAAKKSATENAMGLARLSLEGGQIKINELMAPITLPDAQTFSQLEIPKIYVDPIKSRYLLIIAASTRTSEQQPDHEIEKTMRLYSSYSLTGPWQPGGTSTSVIGNTPNYFAMTVLQTNFKAEQLSCISPTTEVANKPLTFAAPFTIDLKDLSRAEQLIAQRN
ncbi:hypothetical protein QWY82_07900 [Simiduia curdlanivorans]|uniref:Uncharacterized protein n=1 Tax=Simiduia curdlanivorans TaxID=1492769 RepID=A0ABV8V9H6_9GAMM|nr:hypothetical protein [Simiduia curdlanivorans]MDN3638727.1 hypothetical protein [Simiduia curdlanivorans]